MSFHKFEESLNLSNVFVEILRDIFVANFGHKMALRLHSQNKYLLLKNNKVIQI